MSSPAVATGSWRALLGRRYLGISTLLAGGVALYAINEFLTISLLPSTVADIGGERLYAWVTTLYLVGSVVSATTVNAVLLRVGARWAYLAGWQCSASAAWCALPRRAWRCCWRVAPFRAQPVACLPVSATPSSILLCRKRFGRELQRWCR
ncbi:putative multidrug-efflux transporter family protein [Mycobacterium xenopi 4042]|uniref:Putative multidrug-efflux transporter family protein n=1 Tax=Mycobacterium xenopi 4042 TaxID=1299334 RepID=X7YPE1_MYCXE|nr:putative multidrug-efflux transporter family protein [Mycobacterium xenopi 4042]EUA35274.1 putative multidrug-efflux transporter family protein [Mycobacterium xenopi 3993]